ncbi:MAG: YceI family protein [Gemmatimonadetes bacterium]|jgi:polyisoprenoid-binding protein YceI|nr:YceI family protein [Gemmatimonadota bacterium]
MKNLWIAVALLCQAAMVHAGEWHVDEKVKENQVKFTSEVAGFSFEGVTSKVDGYIYWEGTELFEKKNQLLFQVDLNSLDTGIGKRDRDMRNVLGADKWPKAILKGKIVEHEPIDSVANAYRVRVEGKISLHGVEREIEVPGSIIVEEGRSIISAEFGLKLADFDIEAPSLAAFIKVSQDIRIAVSFYMKHVQ